MATYYVRPDGNNSNAGTGPAINQAWATIAYALSSSSGFTSGDTLYVAPGIYTTQISITMSNPTTETLIIGDPKCLVFSGVTAGPIVVTNYNLTLSGSGYIGNVIAATTKNFLHFQNIQFKVQGNGLSFTTCINLKFTRCHFISRAVTGTLLAVTSPVSTAVNLSVNNCIFYGADVQVNITGRNVSDTSVISNCLFLISRNSVMSLTGVQVAISNCTILGRNAGIQSISGSVTFPVTVRNCISRCDIDLSCSGVSNTIIENNNRLLGELARQNVTDNGTSSINGDLGFEVGETLLVGLNNLQPFTSYFGSPNTNFGNSTGAPVSDIYGVTWSGVNPDAGSGTYRAIGAIGNYNPTERNASTITIAPGSTSQSIELYLGATGLTASTSGLSARYNRTRTASVSIPLVARTIAQAWTAGGFAEVDATNMPGVYRLDLPDAALAAGADDVTIVVRGAAGTNGAVMTVKLSSGGLTSAQTASAVWGALTNDHTTHGTFGWNVLRADQDSKEGLVTLHQSGGVSRVDADVHAIANDTDAATELKGALLHDGTGYIDSDIVRISTSTAAADELEGALLHNGTDYISAELLTPVSAATSVHIGPYQLLADGLGADQPLDVNVGTATSIDVQVTDANGTGIDITGATVSAKVYNAGGTLVATYAGTATYADNGRLTFGLTTTVTNTSGTYTVTVTRTTGASDTQVFGPLKLYVRPV